MSPGRLRDWLTGYSFDIYRTSYEPVPSKPSCPSTGRQLVHWFTGRLKRAGRFQYGVYWFRSEAQQPIRICFIVEEWVQVQCNCFLKQVIYIYVLSIAIIICHRFSAQCYLLWFSHAAYYPFGSSAFRYTSPKCECYLSCFHLINFCIFQLLLSYTDARPLAKTNPRRGGVSPKQG